MSWVGLGQKLIRTSNFVIMKTKATNYGTLIISGMLCGGCANSVERALRELEGVTEATVDLKNESASVVFETDSISTNDFRKVIEDAGYEFKGINK
ncbi:MAG: heavy metal-associated domain-containing protein [Balneola sp.]